MVSECIDQGFPEHDAWIAGVSFLSYRAGVCGIPDELRGADSFLRSGLLDHLPLGFTETDALDPHCHLGAEPIRFWNVLPWRWHNPCIYPDRRRLNPPYAQFCIDLVQKAPTYAYWTTKKTLLAGIGLPTKIWSEILRLIGGMAIASTDIATFDRVVA